MKFNHKKFFAGFKADFDDTLDQAQVDAITFLLTSFENEPRWRDVRHIAYALATTYHETAGSMQPVEEGYYLGSARRVKAFQKTLRYYPYFGRGYVQLTWETRRIPNYSKASKALGVDFVKNPELVMVKENAFKIMTLGMFEGWFTTHRLSDYIRGSACDYKSARKIINGLDKAGLIAGYARLFEKILNASVAAAPSPESETSSDPADGPVNSSPSTGGQALPGDDSTQAPINQGPATQVAEQIINTGDSVTPELPADGGGATDPFVQASQGGFKSLVATIMGSIGGAATAVWGALTSDTGVMIVGILCVTSLLLALIFRQVLMDWLRMKLHADPKQGNVK